MKEFVFHNQKNYFAGWYYKHMNHDGYMFSVIPGVCYGEDSHAFIQIIDSNESKYFRYSIEQFSCSKDEIKIGDNYFSTNYLILDIDNYIQAKLNYSCLKPLSKTWYQPTIMGPFSYLKMECNHGIISMYHKVHGYIKKDKKFIISGNGYIEKDYGTSFPKSYLWCQGNDDTSSIFLSVADIPFLNTSFKGTIAVFDDGENQHVFGTYYGCSVSVKHYFNSSKIIIKQKNKQLIVYCSYGNGSNLVAPMNGDMVEPLKEVLGVHIKVKFLYKDKILNKEYQGGFEKKDSNAVKK